MQDLVELGAVDAEHGLLAGDQAFFRHVDGDLQSRLHAALARAALQHPQPAVLDGELDVLDIPEMRLEPGASRLQLFEHLRHQRFERRAPVAGHGLCLLGQRLRRAQARHHVLALGVDQELAVKLPRTGRGIAGEHDAGGAPLAHIAEHHGLHGHRGAPVVGDVVQAAIGDGPGVAPRAEHGRDGAPELDMDILRKGLAKLALDDRLEARDDLGPMLGAEFGVHLEALEALIILERFLEQIVVDAEHHIGVHLDEAAIGVVGESAVGRAEREALDGRVVEAEIEHRIHHAGHRGAGARAHRDEQWIGDVAEARACDLANDLKRVVHHRLQRRRQLAARGVIGGAHVRRDGEAWRHRQAEPRHLGEIGALAAKQIAVGTAPVGAVSTEGEDPFVGRIGNHGLTGLSHRALFALAAVSLTL